MVVEEVKEKKRQKKRKGSKPDVANAFKEDMFDSLQGKIMVNEQELDNKMQAFTAI